MPATPIVTGSITWDEGDPADQLRGRLTEVIETGNPGGGDPGVILIPDRSTPFPLRVAGTFAAESVPDVEALQGTEIEVTRHGATLTCVVHTAIVTRRVTIYEDNAERVALSASFMLQEV